MRIILSVFLPCYFLRTRGCPVSGARRGWRFFVFLLVLLSGTSRAPVSGARRVLFLKTPKKKSVRGVNLAGIGTGKNTERIILIYYIYIYTKNSLELIMRLKNNTQNITVVQVLARALFFPCKLPPSRTLFFG